MEGEYEQKRKLIKAGCCLVKKKGAKKDGWGCLLYVEDL